MTTTADSSPPQVVTLENFLRGTGYVPMHTFVPTPEEVESLREEVSNTTFTGKRPIGFDDSLNDTLDKFKRNVCFQAQCLQKMSDNTYDIRDEDLCQMSDTLYRESRRPGRVEYLTDDELSDFAATVAGKRFHEQLEFLIKYQIGSYIHLRDRNSTIHEPFIFDTHRAIYYATIQSERFICEKHLELKDRESEIREQAVVTSILHDLRARFLAIGIIEREWQLEPGQFIPRDFTQFQINRNLPEWSSCVLEYEYARAEADAARDKARTLDREFLLKDFSEAVPLPATP